MTQDIVIEALRMALYKRHPARTRGRSATATVAAGYASEDVRDFFAEYGITASMSRGAQKPGQRLQRGAVHVAEVQWLRGKCFVTRRESNIEIID